MSQMQQMQVDDPAGWVPMMSLVYTSVAAVPFSEVDLALLLAISRSNNEPDAVTGLLLYRDGRFVQALEGPEAAVRRTLARISADSRHTDVRTIEEVGTERRRFGSWAMGYRSAAQSDAGSPAWFGSPEALEPSEEFRSLELLALLGDH